MQPTYRTRKWTHPQGYKYLAPWTNAVLLRLLIRKFTDTLPQSEYRMKNQINDAARSVVANIEEGYKRPTTKEYLDFLGFSQGSLEEVKGDIKRLMQDGFLKSRPGASLADMGVKLEDVKGLLKDSKGDVPLENLYSPLKSLSGSGLTYEAFLELINKTDYLLRQLVKSLENSIGKEDVLSAFDKWQWKEIEKRKEEERGFEEELKKIVERGKGEKREKRG